jgi:hypothetical protein
VASDTAMPPFGRRLEAWCTMVADRANPLTVRLVRQHLRATSFAVVFVLFLLAGVVLGTWIAGADAAFMSSGRLLFAALISLWMLVAWVVAPMMLTSAIRAERQETTWVLLDLTGMRPLTVLNGFLGAAAVQQALLLAAIAPFLVLALVLRGLDATLVALAVVAIPLGGLASVAGGLQAACSPRKRAGRHAAATLGIGGVLGWLVFTNLLFWSLYSGADGQLIDGLRHGETDTWIGLLLLANLVAIGVATTLASTAMHLTHPAEDRASIPRLLVLLLLANIVAWIVAALGLGVAPALVLSTAAAVLMARTLVLGIGALAEGYARTPRQQQHWQQAHGWRLLLRPLIAPGAASGRRCYLLMLGIAVGLAAAALAWPGAHDSDAVAAVTLAAACHGSWFLLLGDALSRWLLRARHRPTWQRTITVVLALVAGITGQLAYVLLDDRWPLFIPLDLIGGAEAWIALVRQGDTELVPVLLLAALGIVSVALLAGQSLRPLTVERLRAEDL